MVIDRQSYKLTRQNIWFFLFSVLVTGGVFTYLFSTVSFAEVVDVLRGISPRWIPLFLLLSLSTSMFRTWRSQLVLHAAGYRPSNIALFLIILVRNLFSDLLPARLGTLIYIYLVQTRLGIAFGPAAASFAYDFVFDMVSLALLILLAVAAQSSELIPTTVVIAGGIVLGGASLGVLFLLPTALSGLAKLTLSLPLVSQKLVSRMHTALLDTGRNMQLAREQGIFWRIFVLSLGVRCGKYLSLYVLLLGLVLPLGFTIHSFPLPKVFLGLCSAELAASLPISGIAGFGVYEGTWALVFQLLGYAERIAVLTSISHHLLTQVYGYSLGAIALIILLLPFFQREAVADTAGTGIKDRLFWLKFVGVLVVLLAVLSILFPWQADGRQVASSADKVGKVTDISGKDLGNRIQGQLLFERPDGIYRLNLQAKAPERVVSYGSYPRWAPDGKRFAFVQNNAIMVADADGQNIKKLAVADKARAVGFAPDGKSVYFSDGTRLKRVELEHAVVTTVLENKEFREVDVGGKGKRIAATVRTLLGTKVIVVDLNRNAQTRTLAQGCSASLSPDGQQVTVNGAGHQELHLYDWLTMQPVGSVSAPSGMKFDNQYWSNHPHWLVSTSEGAWKDIYLHHVPSDTAYRLTFLGECDRADLFVTQAPP